MFTNTIALIGAPFTGKTELAQELYCWLPDSFRMPEFARVYISKYGPPEHPAEQLYMLEMNYQIERSLSTLYPHVIIDTPTPVYALYGAWLFRDGADDKTRAMRAHFNSEAIKLANAYSHVFYLPPEEPVYTKADMDSVRVLTPQQRLEIAGILREFLVQHVESYHILTGSVAERCRTILQVIQND